MYQKILLGSFVPHHKCGAEIVGASILGATGLLGSLVSSAGAADANTANKKLTREMMQFQHDENVINRDWNAEQAQIGRDFTTSERLAQQQFQQDNWRMQQSQAPILESQALRSVGVNPAVYFSKSGVSMASGGSAPSGVSPSAPSVGMVSSPSSLPQQNVVANIPQMVSSAADMLQSLAGAKKAGVETSALEQQIPLLIEQLQKSNESQGIANQIQKTKLAFDKANLPVALQETFARVQLLKAQEYQAIEAGKEFTAKAALDKAEQALKSQMEKLTTWQALVAENEFNGWNDMFKLRKANLQAQTNQANASAHESSSVARLNSQQYEVRKAAQQELVDQLQQAARSEKFKAKVSKNQSELLEHLITKAKVAADHAEAEWYIDQAVKIAGPVLDAAGEYTRFGMLKEFAESRNNANSSSTVTYYDARGNKTGSVQRTGSSSSSGSRKTLKHKSRKR